LLNLCVQEAHGVRHLVNTSVSHADQHKR